MESTGIAAGCQYRPPSPVHRGLRPRSPGPTTVTSRRATTSGHRDGKVVRPGEGVGAPVDEQDRPAEKTGVGSEQELHERGDLVGAPRAPDWDRELVDEVTDGRIVPTGLKQRRLDRPRRDRIQGDARAR